jgi:hypothetical protein
MKNSFYKTFFTGEKTMKKIIVTAIICCSVFAVYVAGQNNPPKQKFIESCCCKHTQQIAEDLHWIRESMSKPYKSPDVPIFEFPDPPQDPGKLNVTPLKIPDINSPKPKRR